MVRFSLSCLGLLLLGSALHAQDLGRTDRLWREYLTESVRRGMPLLSETAQPGLVPFWPSLERARSEASSLEPGGDVTLISAWMDRAEGGGARAAGDLLASWPRPSVERFSYRQWGETLFTLWEPASQTRDWTDAWLAWSDKAYSVPSLVRGLEVLEKNDPSAVPTLLHQALGLYPDDRRLLPLVARHPEAVGRAEALVARDRVKTGGWAPTTLRTLLNRKPSSRTLLENAGYPKEGLTDLLSRDYGTWLASETEQPLVPGGWSWDADGDGWTESRLVFDQTLALWSRRTPEGVWTLSLRGGLPATLVETRAGSSWTLRWESYPLASRLEYRWGDRTLVYRFAPLAQSIPLWPAARLKASPGRLPASLATLWLPLDPRALASAATTVETWKGQVKTESIHLYQGQVWLQVQDTDDDGRDDTWSYFRMGRLASVYHDPEGRGNFGLRELYRQGELSQVQSRADSRPQNEFVLFPHEGVQLWDPHGDGRPLERIFVWDGEDRLGALVFSSEQLPWQTMPPWEPRP